MGKMKALFLAGLAIGASSAASAADLLPPPPPLPPAPAPAADFGGWYIRADVGVGALQGDSFRSTLSPDLTSYSQPVLPNQAFYSNSFASLGDTTFIGAGVGYQYNSWLRGDLTGEYRNEATYRRGINYMAFDGSFGPGYDVYNAGLSTALFMANAYIDLGCWHGITPYVGGGVGVAAHNFRNLTDTGAGFGYASDTSPANFAWALMAGVSLNVTPNLKLDLGYRYLDMGSIHSNPIYTLAPPDFQEVQSFHVASHDFRLGLRYMFNDGGRAMPVMPLMAKY
jgi:opacity protein-like surface antigen